MTSNAFVSVYQHILDMAERHGVSYASTSLDDKGDAIARLSDNETTHNDATRALVAMRKAGVRHADEAHFLLDQLMDEMGLVK